MKVTIFHNNEHTKIIISDPDITPGNVKKTSSTFLLPSPHYTLVPEKITKLLTPHPMTFIRTNNTTSYAYKTGTAQSQ